MSKFLVNAVAGKFAPTIGTEDPYNEYVVDPKNSKKKLKKKKPIPAFIPPEDAKVLKKFRATAHQLDLCFECCCGCRMGWTGPISLFPWIGDIICIFLLLSLIKRVRHLQGGGVPPSVYSKMLSNVIFDFVIGLIPIIGTFINIAYKCNSRNCLILEHYLIDKYKDLQYAEPSPSNFNEKSVIPATAFMSP